MNPAPPWAMLVTSAPCFTGEGSTLSRCRPVGPSPPSVTVPVCACVCVCVCMCACLRVRVWCLCTCTHSHIHIHPTNPCAGGKRACQHTPTHPPTYAYTRITYRTAKRPALRRTSRACQRPPRRRRKSLLGWRSEESVSPILWCVYVVGLLITLYVRLSWEGKGSGQGTKEGLEQHSPCLPARWRRATVPGTLGARARPWPLLLGASPFKSWIHAACV